VLKNSTVKQLLDQHRQEWAVVIVLRNEALACRTVDIQKTIKLLKIATATAESIAAKQDAERKAYGLR
jgi:hypothetical protein